MKKVLKHTVRQIHKIFIASKHNNYRPHILKEGGALFAIGIFIFSLYFSTTIKDFVLTKTSMLGEVYPAIITSLTNTGRTEQKLGTLTYNKLLENAARNKAYDMVARSYFAHNNPDGKKPWDWIKEAGYEYEYAGENLAINFSDSEDVYTAWMNSPGHRANILNKNYTEIGVATIKTQIYGKDSILVVQMFGQPKNKLEVASDIVDEDLINDNSYAYEPDYQNIIDDNVLGDQYTEPENEIAYEYTKDEEVVLGAKEEINGTASFISTEGSKSLAGNMNLENSQLAYENSSNSPEVTVKSGGEDLNVKSQKSLNISHIKTFFLEIMASPRAFSMLLYVIFMIILNMAIISFGFVEYRHYHKKSIFIGLLLIFVFSAISLAYMYQSSISVTL